VSYFYVALAAICWGLSGGLSGLLITDGWSPLVVAFYRGLFGFLFLSTWLLLRGRSPVGFRLKPMFWASLAGLGVAGNFCFYLISIEEGKVSIAATLMYSAPVFVYVVSFCSGLERPSLSKWVAMVAVLSGILLLTQIYELSSDHVSPFGVLAGLLAGISYGVFIFAFKFAAREAEPRLVLVAAFTVLMICLAIAADLSEAVRALTSPALGTFLLLGLLGGAFSFYFSTRGLRGASPAVTSVIAMVEPVTASRRSETPRKYRAVRGRTRATRIVRPRKYRAVHIRPFGKLTAGKGKKSSGLGKVIVGLGNSLGRSLVLQRRCEGIAARDRVVF